MREVPGKSCVDFTIILLQCHILVKHSWKVDGKAVGAGSSPRPVFGGRVPRVGGEGSGRVDLEGQMSSMVYVCVREM